MAQPIYVEALIRAPVDELWRVTQSPDIHARWDLRFTDIEYLERRSDAEPQRFLYATRIGFGLRIAGTGESVGEHESGGRRSSALKFASDDPRSLILEGSGYWKYVPTENGTRFLTLYDYRTRWGLAGRVVDLVFRPLIGWATAWSFDRVRLYLEQSIDPALSMQRSIAHAACRMSLALVFIWHGLVPKLIMRHPGEIEPITAIGVSEPVALRVMLAAGVAEIAFGLALIVLWRARWLYAFTGAAVLSLGVGATATVPDLALLPFNPVSFTLVLVALALVGWVSCRDLPSARRCLRRRPEGRA